MRGPARLPAMWLTLATLASSSVATAQSLELHGFVQGNYAARVATPAATDPKGDFLVGDNRLQLELGHASDAGGVSFLAKVDLFQDAVVGEADLEVREAYVTLEGSRADLRLGRQIITWGVGDLVFINDVFTKDWTALIAGRPLQYLKVGSDGANLNLYLGNLSAQLIAVPFFAPDRLPTGERLVGYNPRPGRSIDLRTPDQTLENTELAGRLYGYVKGFDTAFYVYRGFWHSPPGLGLDPNPTPNAEPLRGFYPRLSVYGASAQGTVATGVLSAEFGFYDSRDDRDGRHPGIENSQVKMLVGFQQPFGDNLTLHGQYLVERMLDGEAYRRTLPRGFSERAVVRHSVTGRVTRYFEYQTYQLSVFVSASPNEKDYFVNPELRYTIADDVWVAGGANLFGGSADHTFFGQFERNDNVYTTLRYTF